MKRPVVVYAGQGLSLADGFNLTQELRWLKGHCFAEVSEPWNLDEVIFFLLEKRKDSYLREVLKTLDLLCRQDAHTQRRATLLTTTALCERLNKLAIDRLVVLFTSNVDCAARFESVATGAHWLLGGRPHGMNTWAAIQAWMTEIGDRNIPRFHYLPLHGEAGLFSRGDGGLDALATTESTSAAHGPWDYTTAEGLGNNVTLIEQRMHLSQAGYRLFRALLGGARFDAAPHNALAEDASAPAGKRAPLVTPDPALAAHLLVVGYGAPHFLTERPYPFETSVDLAYATIRQVLSKARWKAIVGPDGSGRDWYAAHGFAVEAVKHETPNTCAALITKVLDEFDAAD